MGFFHIVCASYVVGLLSILCPTPLDEHTGNLFGCYCSDGQKFCEGVPQWSHSSIKACGCLEALEESRSVEYLIVLQAGALMILCSYVFSHVCINVLCSYVLVCSVAYYPGLLRLGAISLGSEEAQYSAIGNTIRMVMSKFIDLKKCQNAKQVAFRKVRFYKLGLIAS